MREITHEEYKNHAQRWIRSLVASLDANLPDEINAEVLEACGRACARGDGVSPAQQCQGDLQRYLEMMRIWQGSPEMVRQDGNVVTILCQDCVCPLVQEEASGLSGTYCACSVGWFKENFETVCQGPVEVELIETVRRGGKRCHFRVIVA
jgi:predicted hydrocarbon binding protein